ncbi:hypothetical protein MUB18_20515 [Sphingobacterium sp. PCS056]|uniref:hypothetical protein n=1 Tax=Sphingobacterium sp. PCS056 TaxID=2931400 RepID=UPI00200FA9E3|nr:hypothetical protein [Sphingobacterium sp. PCS056]UPZ36472.1 hypothetical protein MUB18_20515 [Sphingobacterium sp. PCS056]
MENQLGANRVEAAIAEWNKREDRYSSIFSTNMGSNKTLLREKLRYFDRVAANYSGTKNLDEKFALRLMKDERRKIEKQLYSSRILRLLRRWVVVPVRQQLSRKEGSRELAVQKAHLLDQISHLGFKVPAEKIDSHLKNGTPQFNIEISTYVNENERLDHKLKFEKDNTGQYQFEGHRTALINNNKPAEIREHFFSVDNSKNIRESEAYHLLSGRAIKKGDSWLQLDLNDVNTKGEYRVKEFGNMYGYDLDKVLNELPIKDGLHHTEREDIKAALKRGGRQEVSFLKDGNEKRFYIEANPQFKTLNIYDEHSKKITLNSLKEGDVSEALKAAKKVDMQQDNKLQNTKRRNGMKLN